MVIPWIPSNADSWNGSYFNFLYSMNIIYFDMCKWGFMHLKVNRKSQQDYVACPRQGGLISVKGVRSHKREEKYLLKFGLFKTSVPSNTFEDPAADTTSKSLFIIFQTSDSQTSTVLPCSWGAGWPFIILPLWWTSNHHSWNPLQPLASLSLAIITQPDISLCKSFLHPTVTNDALSAIKCIF